MATPSLSLLAVTPQSRNWDAAITTNFQRVKEICFEKPRPLPLVYRSTPLTGATLLSDYPAADYLGCQAYCTDADTPATNGYVIVSNGTVWQYERTGTTVS